MERADARDLQQGITMQRRTIKKEPNVIGFVSAWSLWSVSRLPIEMALIEPRTALVGYGVTFAVPPLAGLLANAVSRFM